MAMSMDNLIQKGKSDVHEKLKEGQEKIEDIGKEFQGVKDQLKDIPGGIDSDLMDMIKDAENEGRDMAKNDVDATNNDIIAAAKNAASDLQSDTQSKMADNRATVGKIDSISSKYGKDGLNRAKKSIEDNTKKGEDFLKAMQDSIKDTDSAVKNVKDNL